MFAMELYKYFQLRFLLLLRPYSDSLSPVVGCLRPIQYLLNIPRSNCFLSVSQERLKSLGNMVSSNRELDMKARMTAARVPFPL